MIKILQYFWSLNICYKLARQKNQMMQNEDSSYQQPSESESQSADLNHLAPEEPQVPKSAPINPPKRQDRQIVPSQVNETVLPNPLANRLMIPSQNRPRLIIDKIVLQNFKSYADTQVIGPFHENFTSVVGPNGSGKSNLIESMLFIFGYKANWMRLNRLNQLIHNSSTMGSVQKASVQVRFKKIIESEDGKIRQLQEAGFSIRRTVKMSGQSKYYINREASTQAQVKNRLKQQGIDLNNNRFLILQGQVQQISQMKQKSGDRQKPGLLEYLQDIIGSNVYIEQIQQSVTQYNAIEETKHEKGQLMKLAEVELKNMNKGKQQAIKFVKKERQIYQIHNILQQVIISNNKYESKEYIEKLQKAEAERERIISQEKQKLKKQAQRIKQIKRNRIEIQNIEKDLAKQNEAMAKMTSADKNINQQISFKSQDLVKYTRKNNQLDSELSKIISQSEEVKVALPISNQKHAKLKVELDEMQVELQKYDKPQLKQKLKNLESEHKKIQYEIKSFEQKYKSTKRGFDQRYKKSENNELKQLQLNRDLGKQTEILEHITAAQTQARKVRQTLQKQLQQISGRRRQVVGQLDKVSSNLREQQDQTKEMNKFADMFQKIMQQNIPGVIGRLGDLGTVSKQYDEIITSCSMGRLDNIVVKNQQAAHSVLNFLKASKLGRVTCIILNRIQQFTRNMDRQWTNLPNSTRLFDVIQPVSDEVRRAFYFAISDTIYCQNSQLGLQYAMKDQRNRRRVVSRKPGGYIICQLNGLMNGCLARSGGFRAKAASKMRNPNDSGEIKQMEKTKEMLLKKLSDLEQKQKNIKAEFDSVNKDLESFKRQVIKVQSKVAEIRQQLTEIQNNLKKNSKNSQQQKEKKQKQLDSLQSQIRFLQKSKIQIQQQISQIQRQQRSQQNQKIIRLRDSYKISKQEYQLLDKDIQKKVAILETSVKRISQNKKSKAQATKKMQMLNRQIIKLTRQREDIQIKATQILGRTKAGEQRIQICKKQQQKLKVLFEEEEKEVKESKLKIEKAKQQVEVCRMKIKEYSDAINNAEQQLKRQRQTYKQLSATYDFMEDIDAIEYMIVDDVKKNADVHNKSDTSVILNQSIDISNTSMTKAFPLERLLETSPFQNLNEDKIDSFLLFTQKMRTMLVAESENLKKMSGSNLQIITEYRKKFSDFKKKHEQFQAVRQSQVQLKKKIEQLKQKRLQLFRQGFSIINSKLKQVYQFLTRGGDAELELIDSLDPFSDGINFSVRPPKKAWKQINKLSGGEKTLSSLSLIFALHYYKPTPLYFMDEIDAALDFKNVSIVADYIKKRTKDAQFIIISLRNNMFELADKLVGVYKTYDKTKIVHFVPSKMRKHPGSLTEKENLDSNRN